MYKVSKQKPVLFYTIGYPGAGKTTLARNLARWFDGPHLRADRIGLQLFVVPTFSEAERKAVYQHMDYQAILALNKGNFVSYDGALNAAAQRHHLHDLAAEHNARAIGIWLDVPEHIARDRAGRLRDVGIGGSGGRIVPPEVFDRYKAAFEAPSANETHIKVDGSLPFSYQYRSIRRQLLGHDLPLVKLIEL
jgi:predicted kinase